MGRSRRPSAGFSFIEILVVMGIIAVLVGLGIGVYQIAAKKTPQVKTDALLQKMRSNVDMWRGQFRAVPPSALERIAVITGLPIKVGKPQPSNTNNVGIETLYQCLVMPGFPHNPDIDAELCNTDEDFLDKPLAKSGAKDLFEIKDAWDNPLVYMVEADYAAFEKDPPTYINAQGEAVNPKPYRSPSGGFAQPNGYQLYSMGPDGQPNTDDDRKAWATD